MSATASPIWQKHTSPEDIEGDDASTTTTTINNIDDNDTDVTTKRHRHFCFWNNDSEYVATATIGTNDPTAP